MVTTPLDRGIVGLYTHRRSATMAAAIVPTATSLEKQLFEVAGALQALEVAQTEVDPTFESLVTLAIDAEGGTVTVTATLPAVIASAGGVLTFTPENYLP